VEIYANDKIAQTLQFTITDENEDLTEEETADE